MSELKRYVREVSSLLECPEKEKEYYLTIIENSIDDDTAQLGYDELVERLGTPQEWVNAHLETKGGEVYGEKIGELKKTSNLQKWIIVAIILVVIIVFVSFYFWNERSRGRGGYYDDPSVISTEIDIIQ